MNQNLEKAKRLWSELGDIDTNEDECITKDWRLFPSGTCVLDIWLWFEEEFNLSVAKDLMFVGDVWEMDHE